MLDDTLVDVAHLQRNESLIQEEIDRCMAVGFDVQGRSIVEAARFAGQVDAGDQPAQLTHQAAVIEIRRPAALAWRHRDSERACMVQRPAIEAERGNDGNLQCCKFLRERMFFEDRGVAPATGSVKFGNDRRGILDADLVDPILVAVQRQKASVAAQAEPVERGQNLFGFEVEIGEGGLVGCRRHVIPARK